jgi:lambda family phage portal protein
MLGKIRNLFGKSEPAIARRPGPTGRGQVSRIYEAARYDRHTEGWFGDYGVSQWDITGQLQIVRNRSREMVKNDPHLQRFIWQRRNNIIGANGFNLTAKPFDQFGGRKSYDKSAARMIQDAWIDWSTTPEYCDAHGRKTFAEILWACDRDWVREGEAILEVRRGSASGPYAVQLLRRRPDSLAIRFLAELSNGNKVYNGVEVDAAGRVAAYWFYRAMLPTGIWGGDMDRVPAEYVCHLYNEDYEGQHRGFPIIACVLRATKILHQYIDAELIKARKEAYQAGAYTVDAAMLANADPAQLGEPSVEDCRTQMQQNIEPGEDRIVAPGWKYEMPTATAPNPNFAPFKQEMLRIVASGIGAAYHNLASDFASINWSAGRLAENEQREGWLCDQQMYINHVLRPVFRGHWCEMLLLSGKTPLPFSKLAKFQRCDTWSGKRWFPADPVNEIPMLETMVRRGWTTDSAIAASFGFGTFAENVEQTRRDDEDAAGTDIANRNKTQITASMEQAKAQQQQTAAKVVPDEK